MGDLHAKKLYRFVTVVFVLLVLTSITGTDTIHAARLQASGIHGTVHSETNAPLSNVKITIQREGWKNTSSLETAQCGCFDSGFLLPGGYTIKFQHSGYRTAIYRHLSIPEGRFVRLNVYLEPLSETKKGTGKVEDQDAAIYEPPFAGLMAESDPYETVIDAEMLKKLPRGLNPLSLAPLVAGVNDEHLFDGLSINGASSSENLYFVDGTDTTTIYSGTSGFDVHIDFVDEISVQSSGLPASRAGSTGGVIDVVTKSGGNRFHGSLQLNVTGDWLDGKPRGVLRHNPYDDTIAEYAQYPEDTWTRWAHGFTLGGYIIKDKLWFYGGFIPSFQKRTRDAVFSHDPEMDRSISQNTTEYQAMLKLTGFLTDRIRLSLSGILDYRKVEGALPELDGLSEGVRNFEEEFWRYPSVSLSGGLIYAGQDVSLRFIGNFWRQNRYEEDERTGPLFYHMGSGVGYAIPEIPIYYIYYWSPSPIANRENIEARFQVKGILEADLHWWGRHHLLLGGQFVRRHVDKNESYYSDSLRFFWGRDFESPTTGVTHPTMLGYVEVRKPYGAIADVHGDSWSVFFQDDWTLGRRLTLTLGVRLESENVPSFSDMEGYMESPIQFDLLDKVSPRLGFVYVCGGSNEMRLHGHYGVYFDSMKWYMNGEQYGGFKLTSHYYDIVYPYWEKFTVADHPLDEYMGGRHLESSNWGIPDFRMTQPNIKPFQKHELSLGFQKRLSSDLELNIRLVHNWIKNAIENIGVQYPYGEVYFICNPGSDWIQAKYDEVQSLDLMPEGAQSVEAVRRYSAITISLDKRFNQRWLGGVSYTWSRLFGNYSGFASSDEYGQNIRYWRSYFWNPDGEFGVQRPNYTNYFDTWFLNVNEDGEEVLGLLPTDRPHQLKVYGAYAFDFGLIVGFNAFAMSGTPVQTEVYLNGMQGWYPYGRGDLGRTPWIWQLNTYLEYNLKLSDSFTFQLSLNIDNITDNDIAQRIFQLYNNGVIYVDEQLIFDGFNAVGEVQARGAHLDPRFNMERNFQPPIAARLGAKLLF
jgi:hypothetical protein